MGQSKEDNVRFTQGVRIRCDKVLARQRDEVGRAAHYENMALPSDLDYGQVSALSMEVRQKLNRHKPETLGQASRISGVTPAAISLLLIHLRRGRFSGFAPEPAEATP